MLNGMSPSWLIVGFLCGSAVAQQSQMSLPISVGIVLDTSGSMGGKLQQSRQLVAQFLQTAHPQDEFFLVQFNDRPVLLNGFGANADEIQNHLTFLQSKGTSALLDAIYLALDEMKKARNPRKALLVISDGGDNSSRSTAGEINTLAREAGVRIYPLGIYGSLLSRERTTEELSGPGRLNEIAEQSGGRHFAVEGSAESKDVITQLRIALRAER